jgi:transposase-like protein
VEEDPMGVRASIRRLRGEERETHARAALGRWRASGATQAEFCRSEGIAAITLRRWRREYGDAEDRAERFVRVDLARERGFPFEIELRDGTRVRVSVGFDAAELAKVLGVLEPGRC